MTCFIIQPIFSSFLAICLTEFTRRGQVMEERSTSKMCHHHVKCHKGWMKYFVFVTPLNRWQCYRGKSKHVSFQKTCAWNLQRHHTHSHLKCSKQQQVVKELIKNGSSHSNQDVLGCGSFNEIQTQDNRLAALHIGTKSNNNKQEAKDIMTEIAASPLLEPTIWNDNTLTEEVVFRAAVAPPQDQVPDLETDSVLSDPEDLLTNSFCFDLFLGFFFSFTLWTFPHFTSLPKLNPLNADSCQ